MSIDIQKEHFYWGLWRAALQDDAGDFLAVLWRDTQKWHLQFRFRYYRDEAAFGSKDEKSWHHYTSKTSDDSERTSMVTLLDGALGAGGIAFGLHNIQFISCQGDGDAFAALLMNPERPGLFRAKLTEEQMKEYERTNVLSDGVKSW